MLYVATERRSWIVIGLVLFCGGAYAGLPDVRARPARASSIWLHPFDPRPTGRSAASYQLVQGPVRHGHRRHVRHRPRPGPARPDPASPRATSSSRRSARSSAWSALFALLLLYGLIVERGLRTALGVRDGFGKLLAAGLAFSVALQCFVVVGGVTRLIPLTGLTMPFLSHGGSSLLANWSIVALLLRISDHARRPAARGARRLPAAGRRPHRGGEGPMNAPSAGCRSSSPCCSRCCSVATTWIQFVAGARRCRTSPATAAPCSRRYSRERGAILVGGDADRPVGADQRTTKVPADLPAGPALLATSPATTRSCTARAAASRAARTRCCPAPPTRCSTAAWSTWSPASAPAGAVRRADHQPGGAEGRRRGAGQPARRRRGPRPADRRDPGDGQPPDVRPDRPGQPRPRRRSQAAWKALNADANRPLVNRAIAGDLYPPGLDVQAGHRRGGAVDSGKYTETRSIPGPAALDLPQTTADLHNDFAGRLRPGRQGRR